MQTGITPRWLRPEIRHDMRILALTNLYPSPIQPQRASFNRHQFRLLAQQHPMRVIAPTLWLEEWNIKRSKGLRMPAARQVMNEGMLVDHPRYWYTPKVLRGLYGHFYRESVRAAFRRAVAEFSPDIVFTPWAYPDGWAATELARSHGLPVVLQVHGSDVRQLDQFTGRIDGTRRAITQADGVIAVSADLGRRVIEMGADPDRVRVIVDGVDKSEFFPGDRSTARQLLGLAAGTRHLLFVGNLVDVKGIDVLLQACAGLGDSAGTWHLHLIGDGPLRGQLTRLSESLGLASRVTFHGSIAHAALPGWFRAADLFVLPSRSEGVPNVLLEASACHTPYIASDVGGIPEIAACGASRLVQPEQVQALASAIAECLASPPVQPATGPRDRVEAAADAARFLAETLADFRKRHVVSRNSAA